MRGRKERRIERFGRRRVSDFRQRPAGAVIGVVTNNTDPDGWGRIKVRFPWLHDAEESHWARIAQPYAGAGRGSFWLPEIGDEVVVVFDRNDPNQPYVLGGVWNGNDAVPPPGNPDGVDNHKIWRTRNGHQIIFEDTEGGERITIIDGPNKRHLVIDVAADTITLTADPGDITYEAPKNTLTVDCVDLEIDVRNSSTWKVDAQLSETSDTRSETIQGADTIKVADTWSLTAPSTSVSAQTSSLSAQVIGVSVTGALTMTNMAGRSVTSKEVRRTSAPETVTAGTMKVQVGEMASYVTNGPISVTSASQNLKSPDATITCPAVLTVMGGTMQLNGTTGLGVFAEMTKLA